MSLRERRAQVANKKKVVKRIAPQPARSQLPAEERHPADVNLRGPQYDPDLLPPALEQEKEQIRARGIQPQSAIPSARADGVRSAAKIQSMGDLVEKIVSKSPRLKLNAPTDEEMVFKISTNQLKVPSSWWLDAHGNIGILWTNGQKMFFDRLTGEKI
jgi:hypothetical protein